MDETLVRGQGGFGCVIAPPLACMDKSKNNDKAQLAKIQTIENMKKELAQNEIIDDIDPDENYHMKALGHCIPNITDTEYEILRKEDCKDEIFE